MATWLEKLRKANERTKEQEKLAREMTHSPQAPIESLRGQDPLTDWGLGVRERTLSPLSTLAGEAKRFQGLSPQEMGMELVGGGIAGTFIGKGAKTWKAAMKDTAEQLEKQGVSPEEIWKQTGTFRGADKEWRQEIDDSAAKFILPFKSEKLGGQIDHPELFKAYPQLSNIPSKVAVHDMFKGNPEGSYQSARELLDADGGTGVFVNEQQIFAGADNPETALNYLLHETQHPIQDYEKFARGGSVDEMIYNQPKETGRLQNETPYDAYKRLAGEAEARLTQARMNMTPSQRAASYPPSMFDVPMENQIVRMSDLAR